MVNRTKVVSIELTQPIQTISHLAGYQRLLGLVRWRGVPLSHIVLPVIDGGCSAQSIVKEVTANHHHDIARELIRQQLISEGATTSWDFQSLFESTNSVNNLNSMADLPTVSVIVCPRLQTETYLSACLESLQASTVQPLEIIVPVPSDDIFQSTQAAYPHILWLLAPVESRSVQRNLAIQAAQGEIVAFVDDVCQVDPNWVEAIALAFASNANVAAMAGLVMSSDIETDEDAWFEQKYSLNRGIRRIWHHLNPTKPIPWTALITIWLASGANMAFRQSLLKAVGAFDPALDYAGYTWAGADLELFARVLLAGHTLLYEPSAMVRHNLPTCEIGLQSQVKQDAVGLYSYIAAGWHNYPTLRQQWLTIGIWKIYRLLLSLVRPDGIPRSLIFGELLAMGQSWGAYSKSQQLAEPQPLTPQHPLLCHRKPPQILASNRFMAVRTVDLNQPLQPLTGTEEYEKVRVFVTVDGSPIGYVDCSNDYRQVSTAQLQQAIASELTDEILALNQAGTMEETWSSFQSALKSYLLPYSPPGHKQRTPLPAHVSVSIIITTCDRPDDLSQCLEHLLALEAQRPIEIVVADNRPASGITPKVISRYPGVKLVQEARPGAAYGRNAAIAASTGDIIVTIDDDISVPTDWLEKLIAPMARPEVMVVTGNVLPKELETPAQFLFEQLKGGLSQGYSSFEADGAWLAATQKGLPPVWDLGVSANAAFRAEIFCHPQIGLMDETLGPGTPTSSGEECYLIYRVLRANYTVVYEPSAYAWHRHRRELDAFYHQVYSHMKGGMAFMLCVWLKDGDQRAFHHLFFQMPSYLTQRVIGWALRRHPAPLKFVWNEIKGYLDAFWSYRQSCLRVQQLGLSDAYIPTNQRLLSAISQEASHGPLSISPCVATPNPLARG
ncbi:MAG: glycosyltransferase [Leptolyngbya sp. DLM2.Bin27]|nr:MAG: glycosyltransferase [Leptolyngbya sp. DLM2.Bin27]